MYNSYIYDQNRKYVKQIKQRSTRIMQLSIDFQHKLADAHFQRMTQYVDDNPICPRIIQKIGDFNERIYRYTFRDRNKQQELCGDFKFKHKTHIDQIQENLQKSGLLYLNNDKLVSFRSKSTKREQQQQNQQLVLLPELHKKTYEKTYITIKQRLQSFSMSRDTTTTKSPRDTSRSYLQ
ncbi:hypothetical protein pb186bvf_012791 [Paramecium bursaria]